MSNEELKINDEACGVLIVNKHAGCTSLNIVNRVRRLFNTKRVGHTGTLDPMATGVLVVLVGRAAKAAELVPSDKKRYRARLRLGLTSDTEDITGTILTSCEDIPDENTVQNVCKRFVGEIDQIPPMYSALKVDGKKLYDLARQGITVERKPRKITIFSLDCQKTEDPCEYILNVECSGGTYIRTLCADIGQALGCGGVMAALERTEACSFPIEESMSVEELFALDDEALHKRLIPIESLFTEYPNVVLPTFYERLFRSGCEIYQKKISSAFDIGEKVRVSGEKCGFFALGEVKEYENGSAIKSVKLFSI